MIDPKVLKLEKYYNLANYKLILSKRPVNTHDRPFLFTSLDSVAISQHQDSC